MNKWKILTCGLCAYLASTLFLRVVALEIMRQRRQLQAVKDKQDERSRREAGMVVGTASALSFDPASRPPRKPD